MVFWDCSWCCSHPVFRFIAQPAGSWRYQQLRLQCKHGHYIVGVESNLMVLNQHNTAIRSGGIAQVEGSLAPIECDHLRPYLQIGISCAHRDHWRPYWKSVGTEGGDMEGYIQSGGCVRQLHAGKDIAEHRGDGMGGCIHHSHKGKTKGRERELWTDMRAWSSHHI